MKRLLFMCLLICHCDNGPYKSYEQLQKERSQDQINTIIYYKDTRTNMCFAGTKELVNRYSSLLTNVPCTPEVEKLIQDNK